GPVAGRAAGVVAQADGAVPPWPGGVAPVQFGAGVFEAAIAAFAFAAQPELVEVAADARAQVPAQCVVVADLELVAAEHRDQRVLTHVRAHVHAFEVGGECGGALGRRGNGEGVGRWRLRAVGGYGMAVLRVGIGLLRRRGGLPVPRVAIVLRERGQDGAGGCRQQGEDGRSHSTRTSRNMPSSMCSSMWQWYAHRPIASALTR